MEKRCNESPFCETILQTKEQTMTDHYDVIIIGTGAVNPSLTIMANALRVGEYLLERIGSKSVVE
jgi:choline dehydrogenase-like flavoprotein